jgi:serine phosphatase RsbU (regulator of sigma subunit)
VADKGIGAALFMTSSRTLLRAYAAENVGAPENVLYQANQRITQDIHGGLFITLFYGVLDPLTGELLYCNAGHNPPFLLSAIGEEEPKYLQKTGIPLGIFPDATWHTHRLLLTPGSTLALYTDGVTEASGPGNQIYGEERLLEALQASVYAPDANAINTLRAVLDSVDRFRGKTAPSDDLTVVVLQRDRV